MLLEMNKCQLMECSRITPRISLPLNPQVFPCKNQALGWREVEDLVLWSRGWSGREREMNEGGEGVYILPPPKVTVVCFLVEPGSSGVSPDHLGCEQNRQNTHSKSQVRIIWYRVGSSGLGHFWTLTSHQVRIILPRAGSSGLTPKLRALFGRIIRPKAGSSDLVLKLVL